MSKQNSRNPGTAPRLQVHITPEQWTTAIASDSGACLIADAIKRDYPAFTGVSVDMATVRVTDPSRSERYTWLTPGAAQMLLLGFDQGWRQLTEEISLRDAVQITKIKKKAPGAKVPNASHGMTRRDRLAYLESKEEEGELAGIERKALATMRATDARHAANNVTFAYPPVESVDDRPRGAATVHGGKPIPTGRKHPNLLATRKRHYGAKLAQPGVAFEEAVADAAKQLAG